MRSFVIEVMDRDALAARAAALIVARLRAAIGTRGRAVLVPSAGRTPIATYRVLRELHARSLDWARVHVVQMDEYRGVGAGDPRGFAHFLACELVRPLRVGAFTHFHDASGALLHPLAEYEAAAGRIDLVVHGIGRNGHIGFNEPGSAIDSGCRIVRLAASTRRANLGEGERRDCRDGVTLGLKTLLAARGSLLLATGAEKSAALAQACGAPPSDRCPASRLRGAHDVVVLADPAAASRIRVMHTWPQTGYRGVRLELLGGGQTGATAASKNAA